MPFSKEEMIYSMKKCRDFYLLNNKPYDAIKTERDILKASNYLDKRLQKSKTKNP